MTEEQLTPPEELRIELLVDRMLEGALTAQELEELESIIAGGPETLERFLQSINLRAWLIWDNTQERVELVSVGALAVDVRREGLARAIGRRRRYSMFPIALGSAAALLLAAAGVVLMRSMVLTPLAGRATEEASSVGSSQPPSANVGTAAGEAVAHLRWASSDARWRGHHDEFRVNSALLSGEEVYLEWGKARLHFRDGTEVTMFSPARVVSDFPNQCRLLSGSISVHASETNKGGFAVLTNNGKIIDIGTDFEVVVDDFGLTEVGVLKGKVVAYPETDSLQPTRPIELLEGDRLQWNTALHVRFNAERGRLGALADGSETGDLAMRPEDLVLSDDFGTASLDPRIWSTLGRVVPDVGYVQLGKELGGQVDKDDVPYLITKQQLDPAAGAIVVTGSVAFSERLHSYSGSLSLFTRAESQRGSFPRTGYAYLATGLRCTFWPVANQPGQTMRVLVRPFSASENVGILGEEFPLSQVSSHWGFRLVDDGVNVTFTVRSLDGPSIDRTVSCRSLFRGKANSIAFEGDPNSSVRLTDIKIYQQPDRDDRSGKVGGT